ncbi:hypothetical protein Hypma_007739 [Hypsizygus marmoreus]|uniref:Uncharacterized protein n=1 Tax=Hypsizygus marmoreus TaxID=39966 RepID=A0A369JT16_HYPMA|nr:hypothetical protein Hypma_007739 [Hypsizygus marmoreus]
MLPHWWSGLLRYQSHFVFTTPGPVSLSELHPSPVHLPPPPPSLLQVCCDTMTRLHTTFHIAISFWFSHVPARRPDQRNLCPSFASLQPGEDFHSYQSDRSIKRTRSAVHPWHCQQSTKVEDGSYYGTPVDDKSMHSSLHRCQARTLRMSTVIAGSKVIPNIGFPRSDGHRLLLNSSITVRLLNVSKPQTPLSSRSLT